MVGIGYDVPEILPGNDRPPENRLGRNPSNRHRPGIVTPG